MIGTQGTVDELWLKVLRVCVCEHHEVAPRDREAPPHRVALAVGAAVVGEQLVLGVDLGALRGGDLGGAIRRVSVHHEDLVYQRRLLV
jgi:hypothetical protein